MEQKRLLCGGGMDTNPIGCGEALGGLHGHVESWGRDSIPLLGPEPLRAIVHVDTAWTWCGQANLHCCLIG